MNNLLYLTQIEPQFQIYDFGDCFWDYLAMFETNARIYFSEAAGCLGRDFLTPQTFC